jgi:hypothetical protein
MTHVSSHTQKTVVARIPSYRDWHMIETNRVRDGHIMMR